MGRIFSDLQYTKCQLKITSGLGVGHQPDENFQIEIFHFHFIFHLPPWTHYLAGITIILSFSWWWSRLNFEGILFTFSTECLNCLEASRQDVTRLTNKQERPSRLSCLSITSNKNLDFKQDSFYVSQSTPTKQKMISYLLIVVELPLTVSQQEGKTRRNVTCAGVVS